MLCSLAQICKLCCCSTSSVLLLLVQTFQLLFVTAQEMYCCHWHRHFIFPFAAQDLYSCHWHRLFHLFLLQHKVYQQAVKVPEELKDIMNEETYNKARVYGLDTSSFSIVKELFSIAITVVRHYLIELCITEIDKTE